MNSPVFIALYSVLVFVAVLVIVFLAARIALGVVDWLDPPDGN